MTLFDEHGRDPRSVSRGYEASMSDRLDEAIAKVRQLPEDRQEEAADMLLDLVEHDPAQYRLSDAQLAEVRRRLAEPPDYASDAEVEEAFDRLTR